MKNMFGHSVDHWAAAVVLQRILTSGVAFEDTVVVFTLSILEPPVRAPAVPNSGEDGCMDTRWDKFG